VIALYPLLILALDIHRVPVRSHCFVLAAKSFRLIILIDVQTTLLVDKGKHEECVVSPDNVPTCACKQGYVLHKKYGCVDESPPLMQLNHDPIGDKLLRLKQGDVYKEFAVDIADENAEEYLRSLKITYSRPIPHGCLTSVGEFHVNYTVATPWTTPPFVRVTRLVVVDDVDECTIDVNDAVSKICPSLIHHCDLEAGATCMNTFGSYSCRCPNHTVGDGFMKGLGFPPGENPEGFDGGTSCVDTSKPVIQLRGPNPTVLRVCPCRGLAVNVGASFSSNHTALQMAQQNFYFDDLKVSEVSIIVFW
jgi:hypothetical protein